MTQEKYLTPARKYVVQLKTKDNRWAVGIDRSPKSVLQRAAFQNPRGGWEDAETVIITTCRRTLTSRILAIECLDFKGKYGDDT